MGDLSSEPSMEDILSSIKRIIAEEGDGASPARSRRPSRTAPAPEPEGDDSGDEAVLELDHPVAPPRDAVPEPVADDPRPLRSATEAMLSARSAETTRGQLEALSRMVVKPEVAGSDTLEGLVRQMLKPMLSEWLDQNLPRIVEAMVAKEIARISAGND